MSGDVGARIGTITKVAIGTAPTSACSTSETQIQFSNGTITGVNSGTGLTGGGSAGSVTLRVAPAYRLPQGCSGGGVAESNGSNAWTCAPPVIHGTGNVDHGFLVLADGSPGQTNFLENPLGQFSAVCDGGAEIFWDTKLAVSSEIVWWNKDGVGSTTFGGAQLTPKSTSDYVAMVQVLWADGRVQTGVVTQHVDPDTHACTFTGQEMLG